MIPVGIGVVIAALIVLWFVRRTNTPVSQTELNRRLAAIRQADNDETLDQRARREENLTAILVKAKYRPRTHDELGRPLATTGRRTWVELMPVLAGVVVAMVVTTVSLVGAWNSAQPVWLGVMLGASNTAYALLAYRFIRPKPERAVRHTTTSVAFADLRRHLKDPE